MFRTIGLLVRPPVVFEPACHVPAFRVVVCPVDHATLWIPQVFAIETYVIALA